MLSSFKLSAVALAALPFVVASCAPPKVYKAYEGPTLDRSRVATVEGNNPSIQGLEGSGATIYIASIDGKTAIGDWKAPAVVVEVLPGAHAFGLTYAQRSESPGLAPYLLEQQLLYEIDRAYRQTIRFRTQAGSRYIIFVDTKAKRYGVRTGGGRDVPVTVLEN